MSLAELRAHFARLFSGPVADAATALGVRAASWLDLIGGDAVGDDIYARLGYADGQAEALHDIVEPPILAKSSDGCGAGHPEPVGAQGRLVL